MNNSLAFVPGVSGTDEYEKRVCIETHENVSITYDIAGVGSRCLAAWFDKAIRVCVYAVSLIIGLILSLKAYNIDDIIETVAESFNDYYYAFMALYLGLILVRVLYHLIAELISAGSSPGKKLVGIKVVQLTGEAATPLQLIIRNLLRFIDMIPGGSAIDGIIAMYDKYGRRVGDFAAGTMVIKYRDNLDLSKIEAEALSAAGTDNTDEAPENEDEDYDILSFVKKERENAAGAPGIPTSGEVPSFANAEENPSAQNSALYSDENPKPELFFDEKETKMFEAYLKNREKYLNRYIYDQRFAALISIRRGYEKTSGFTEKEALDILKAAENFLKIMRDGANTSAGSGDYYAPAQP